MRPEIANKRKLLRVRGRLLNLRLQSIEIPSAEITAVQYYGANLARVRDVDEWIRVQQHQVRALPFLDCAGIGKIEKLAGIARGGLQRLHRSKPSLDQQR